MKRPGRRLTGEETALWTKVTRTVTPLAKAPPRRGEGDRDAERRGGGDSPQAPRPAESPLRQPAAGPPPPAGEERKARPLVRSLDRHGLDAGWDRRLARGLVAPDFTLDLHGATLDEAHARLEHGLTLAQAQGARLVLLITGRLRPSDERAGRGVIRRKFMDWLAAGPHASRIAAVRPAHPRHGGAGAVYIVLRKAR